MQAVVPVAGEGSRLRPLTDDRPKALVEAGGRPILDWVLHAIAPPVTDVCLVVHPDHRDALGRRYGEEWNGIRIVWALQRDRRGVAHAVSRARPHVSGPFAVVMGDAFYSEPLGPCLDRWAASTADGAVVVERVSDPPEDPIGLVEVEGGEVVAVEKAPWQGRTPFRIAGVFCFPESAFDVIEGLEPSSTGELELEAAVTRLLRLGKSFAAVEYEGWRRNVNTAEDLRSVEARIRDAAGEEPP